MCLVLASRQADDAKLDEVGQPSGKADDVKLNEVGHRSSKADNAEALQEVSSTS